MYSHGEARPDLSGALFLFSQKRKKRERKADKGAQMRILSWTGGDLLFCTFCL